MKQVVNLIEKVEGEAELRYTYKNSRITSASISFFSSRYIEKILENRAPLDALAINPRVCGICGHAHLIATVRALEGCLSNFKISKKAEIFREITLALEILQNHFKWFYLTIIPLLGKNDQIEKALLPSRIIAEMIALIAGQYPHNSYTIPGGIVTQVTTIELIGIKERLDEIKSFFKKSIIDADPALFSECDKIEKLLSLNGDLPLCMKKIIENGWENHGKSLDSFIVFAEGPFERGKSIGTRVNKTVDVKYISEEPIKNSEAFRVLYKKRAYEVGPLARAMVKKKPLIKEVHRKFLDSILTRILARVCEIPQLLLYMDDLLKRVDLSEQSWIEPPKFPDKCRGVGAVEAARGSLVHQVDIEDGKIKHYSIITPTQWNLACSDSSSPGPAQKAIIGQHINDPIELIFKSFDVCSACTTH